MSEAIPGIKKKHTLRNTLLILLLPIFLFFVYLLTLVLLESGSINFTTTTGSWVDRLLKQCYDFDRWVIDRYDDHYTHARVAICCPRLAIFEEEDIVLGIIETDTETVYIFGESRGFEFTIELVLEVTSRGKWTGLYREIEEDYPLTFEQ